MSESTVSAWCRLLVLASSPVRRKHIGPTQMLASFVLIYVWPDASVWMPSSNRKLILSKELSPVLFGYIDILQTNHIVQKTWADTGKHKNLRENFRERRVCFWCEPYRDSIDLVQVRSETKINLQVILVVQFLQCIPHIDPCLGLPVVSASRASWCW